MKYSYRMTRANRATGRVENYRLEVETDGWREYIRNANRTYYSNTADIIDQIVWPFVEAEKPNELCAALVHYYLQWKKTSPSIIFEFAMYMWREFQAGRVSADVWAATLAAAWQSGERGMVACVVMSPALVVKMFKSAPLKTLHEAARFKDDDLHLRCPKRLPCIGGCRRASTTMKTGSPGPQNKSRR